MKPSLRIKVRLAAIALVAAAPAFAQPYPAKPVRLIVPFPAGGGSDVVGRLVAQKLSERTGQQVFVDNRAGAGGSIGTEVAVKSPPDGYTTVLASTSEVGINPALYKLTYDPVRDLTPVVLVGATPMVILVHPSLPVKTLKDVVALAKAKPGELNVASAGNGTITHLSGEMFRSQVGAKWTHVPYKGAPPALTDLASGQVQVMFSSLPAAMAFLRANRIKPLAVSSQKRAPALPDTPTAAEAGIGGYDVEYWYGLFVPAAVTKDVVARLHDETTQVLRQPDFVSNLASQGATTGALTQAQFADFVKSESGKWGQVVRASGAKAD